MKSTPNVIKSMMDNGYCRVGRSLEAIPENTGPPDVSARRGSWGGREAKILVLGDNGVGKSALIVRYLTKRFIGDYDPLSESLYTFNTVIDAKSTTLKIIDTVNDDHNHNGTRMDKFQWADGFLLVFSYTDRKSFDNICRFKEEVCSHVSDDKDSTVPIVVVANKSDLLYTRTVSQAEARCLATKLKCPLIETTARESFPSVVTAFTTLYKEIASKNGANKKLDKLKRFLQRPSVIRKLQKQVSTKPMIDRNGNSSPQSTRSRTFTV